MTEITNDEYNKRVKELAYNFLDIRTCKKCGSPVINGYVCMYCQDTNPSEESHD
jgi:ribosomal protein L32